MEITLSTEIVTIVAMKSIPRRCLIQVLLNIFFFKAVAIVIDHMESLNYFSVAIRQDRNVHSGRSDHMETSR